MWVDNTLRLEDLKVSATTKNLDGETIDRFPNLTDLKGLIQETASYHFERLMMQKLDSKQSEFFDSNQ